MKSDNVQNVLKYKNDVSVILAFNNQLSWKTYITILRSLGKKILGWKREG